MHKNIEMFSLKTGTLFQAKSEELEITLYEQMPL
jgi:hypothetical protein